MKKQLKFPIQAFGIAQFSFSFLPFLGLLLPAIKTHSLFFNVFIFILLFRIFIYPLIDYILPKTILLEQEKLYLKIAFLKIKLNKENVLFAEEDVFLFTRNSGPHTSINLYQNRHRIFRLSFKNKIRIYLMPTEEELETFFRQLKTDFDVKCIKVGGRVF